MKLRVTVCVGMRGDRGTYDLAINPTLPHLSCHGLGLSLANRDTTNALSIIIIHKTRILD